MAGVLIPVAIHLWNNKQGKVLAIGSVAFLEKASRKKARSWKVTERLLLVLRCLLLVLLSLLLAGPYWPRTAGGHGKGWLLVGVVGKYGAVIDSLEKAGYERHALGNDSNWWQGFSRYDREAPAGLPFFVFTDDALRHFRGARPVSDREVYWRTSVARGDTQWVARAWVVGKDSVGMIRGRSGPTGTSYTYSQERRSPGDEADPAMLRVLVCADGIDGQWLTAAVRAVQQFSKRNIELTTYNGVGQLPVGADWVFWLSGRPVPEGLSARNLLTYVPGKEIPVDTWVRDMRDVRVEKMVAARPEQGGRLMVAEPAQGDSLIPVWRDGFGRVLLGVKRDMGVRTFRFFSRFDPAWNGLVWSADFPAILGRMLFGEGEWSIGQAVNAAVVEKGLDRRVIDPEQVTPVKGRAGTIGAEGALPAGEQVAGSGAGGSGAARATAGGSRATPQTANIDLAPAGWVLIWLLLLVERVLSFKRSK